MEFGAPLRTCLWLKDEAEELARFYTSLLPDSRIDAAYPPGPEGPYFIVEFTLGGAPFMAMNSNDGHTAPTGATSISVLTANQAETDRLWETLLSNGGEAGPCGWLKDRYGFSWQIIPKALPRLMHGGSPEQGRRVSAAMMKMQKLIIADLEAAAADESQS